MVKSTYIHLYTEAKKTMKQMHTQLYEELALLQQIKQYEQQNTQAADNKLVSIIKLIGEIRSGIYFIALDICVSQRALVRSEVDYESIFHTKNLYTIISEGYKYLYTFRDAKDKTKKRTYWYKLEDAIRSLKDTKLLDRYITITTKLVAFGDIIDQNLRNLVLHYDDMMVNVYDVSADISIDEFSKTKLSPFLDLLTEMLTLTKDIQMSILYLADAKGKFVFNTAPEPAMKLHTYIASYIDKNKQLMDITKRGIIVTAQDLDMFRNETSRCVKMEDYICSELIGLPVPNELQQIKQIANIHMLLRFMITDITCLLRAYLTSESEIEYKLNLRRVIVTKTSTLIHLVGYTDPEKENALWGIIKKIIPVDDIESMKLATDIELLLRRMTFTDDKKKRILFVHLANNSNGRSNISELMESLNQQELLLGIPDTIALIKIYNFLNIFLTKLTNSLAKRTHKANIESTNNLNNILNEIVEKAKKIDNSVFKEKIIEKIEEVRNIFMKL